MRDPPLEGTGGSPSSRKWAEQRFQAAHAAGIFNRALVEASQLCGCTFCLATFPASEVTSWCDPRPMPDRTALCPRCEIDC